MPTCVAVHTRARSAASLHPLAAACLLLCAPWAAAQTGAAAGAPSAAAAAALPPSVQLAAGPAMRDVVVSATRGEQAADSLPLTVDVIHAPQMEAAQVSDIRELANQLPNVQVARSPVRFGLAGTSTGRDQNSGFNIRGLDGNRVLMLVDGVRQPRAYSFSANSFGRDYLDLGLVQRVEILRGSVPALYGSDGMGGLVNFITLQPSDLLTEGKSLAGRLSASYDGSDQGKRVGATVAGRLGSQWSWLLAAGAGRSSELDTMGSNHALGAARTAPNPEKGRNHSLLGRLVYAPSAAHKQVLTFETVEKQADYRLLTANSASVRSSDARTDMNRWRATWQGQWQQLGTAWADEVQLAASYQSSDANEWANEVRQTLPYRERQVDYAEKSLQLTAQASKLLRWAPDSSGKFTYGVDLQRNQVRNEQNGILPPAGESFPLKRFPDTTETSLALFTQAELHFGRFSITPGVRADQYRSSPSQAGFLPSVQKNSDSAVSPKLGLMFQATDAWAVYGNYAAGFRAPNAGQVNAFFENVTGGYRSVSNPALKPEKSQTFELGLRGRLNGLNVDTAVFTGRYKDFIKDQQMVSGQYGNLANPATFQSINIDRVRISGLEVKADYDWGRAAGGQWRTHAAFGYTQGKETNAQQPLDTISPQQWVLGLRYDAAAVGVQLSAVHWARKKSGDAAANTWLSPSATVLDLSAQWRVRPGTRLNVGIYNLTDKKHWRWADVRNLAANTQIADAYSQPGRHVRVSLVQDF